MYTLAEYTWVVGVVELQQRFQVCIRVGPVLLLGHGITAMFVFRTRRSKCVLEFPFVIHSYARVNVGIVLNVFSFAQCVKNFFLSLSLSLFFFFK